MSALISADELLVVAEAAFGGVPQVRDAGAIASASARPATTVFGEDAYPDLWSKAAALMHSVARVHPLVDGNKRTAWVAARVLLALNGVPAVPVDVDRAEEFVIAVTTGVLDEVPEIAVQLRGLYAVA
ncbi:type II toxin-antitoxin system death-on-curing family toxin [Yinghuangia seranimata]|uniref:type II toxin-antitoxin system death-on-curing family toxin n=1 Tax=Yinghuangia seranimata TaxID=408067 RepID=UPI00248B8E5B|nr:Fic family protein [Yinghuangia seranimata]MDI2128272.1 Fic family protein [Yinghuangia seranimata]